MRPNDSTGFDVILGNPPFLNQLESATASGKGPAAMLQTITDGVISGYTDVSATFLYQSVSMCRDRGRVALVQPQSLLAAKDAGPVRGGVLDTGSLTAIWVSNEHVFEGASVFTCAPTLEIHGPRQVALQRSSKGVFERLPDLDVDIDELATEETWAHLVAAASGIPEVSVMGNGVIGDFATATADFRDQYYGLDGFLVEDCDVPASETEIDTNYPPIVTTGLIDLAACHWGGSSTRLLKTKWEMPRIDRRRMNEEGTLGPWMTERLVPKIMVATQTKVLEVFVDVEGRFVPSIPLITVSSQARERIWHIAAALASPVCTAIGMQKYAGAALSASALKLSAKQILALPLPSDETAWGQAASDLKAAHSAATPDSQAGHLLAMGRATCDAYGVPKKQQGTLLAWWRERLHIPDSIGETNDGKG